METIAFLFPSEGSKLSGGLKVICEYANRLSADGYTVHIVYAGSFFWSDKTPYFKFTACVRYLQRLIQGYSCRKWFALDRKVKEHYGLSLNQRHVPNADIYVATSPYTAMYLNDYRIENNRKYYFIQDYENWGDVTDDILLGTYRFNMHKIVISTWLKRIMNEQGVECRLVPNGFDFEYFKLSIPIEKKDKYLITMLNHSMERKGCKYGFEALQMVKQRYPQLRVNLFGTSKRPTELPEWYNYYQSPDKKTLNRIYNEAAIFIGPSIIEGWGLTVGEAMICGQAVACTDNQGYREMAIDNKTALLSPVKDSERLAENVMRLIENDTLRYEIAGTGNRYIKRFTWESAYGKLLEALDLKK